MSRTAISGLSKASSRSGKKCQVSKLQVEQEAAVIDLEQPVGGRAFVTPVQQFQPSLSNVEGEAALGGMGVDRQDSPPDPVGPRG
jgi:hypothetical protein